MSRIVAVAPTLSDAVQSVGGSLARHAGDGHEVVVVTVFDGAHDVVQQEAVAEMLGLTGIVRIDLPAGDQLSEDDEETATAAAATLAISLSKLEPELVLSPIGLAGDAKVRVVNRALDALTVPRLRWVDLPYALTRTPGAPLGAGQLVVIPIANQVAAKFAACSVDGADSGRLRAHAESEGVRLGVGEPVELLLGPVNTGAGVER